MPIAARSPPSPIPSSPVATSSRTYSPPPARTAWGIDGMYPSIMPPRIGKRFLTLGALVLAGLAGCSGGAPTSVNPQTTPPTVQDYTGPAPSTTDIQAFPHQPVGEHQGQQPLRRLPQCGGSVAEVRTQRRCESRLRGSERGGEPHAARPVPDGHQGCRRPQLLAVERRGLRRHPDHVDPQLGGLRRGGGRQIALQAPSDHDVGSAKSFPLTSALFASTIYPVLHNTNQGNCVRCHAASAATPQSPFFASNDVDEAYAAARAKINLDNPANSRWSCACGTSRTTAGAATARTTPPPCSPPCRPLPAASSPRTWTRSSSSARR